MTLDERLARDADTWRRDDRAPDLDGLLARVSERHDSVRWLRWAPAAAAVLVLAAAALLAVRPWGHPSQPAATSGGIRHVAGVPVLAFALDPGRPRVLVVYTRCTVRQAHTTAAALPGGPVVVRVSGLVDYSAGPTCSTAPTRLTVRLAQPLGHRPVYDGDGSVPLAVLDPTQLPRPGYLPPGYRPDGVQPVDPGSGRLLGERDYRRGTARVVVMLGYSQDIPANAHDAGTDRDTATRVHGRTAFVTFGTGTCVTWTVRTAVDASVCSLGGVGTSALPAGEVVRIARSVS